MDNQLCDKTQNNRPIFAYYYFYQSLLTAQSLQLRVSNQLQDAELNYQLIDFTTDKTTMNYCRRQLSELLVNNCRPYYNGYSPSLPVCLCSVCSEMLMPASLVKSVYLPVLSASTGVVKEHFVAIALSMEQQKQ